MTVSDVGYPQVQAAASYLRERVGQAEVGVVLGSGLGKVADVVQEDGGAFVDYSAVPHFPVSSVSGHKGRLVFGKVKGIPVLLMQGRVHRYEGYTAQQTVFPIRVLAALGVKHLVVTNAAGGLGDGFTPGDLMLIDDHLNLTGDNPLAGPNDERFGPRFPDMSDAYSARLRAVALEVAKARGLSMKRGVYCGLYGPSYETPAEIRMLKLLGAHAVGMSTVHEVITANHAGLEVLGISCITNLAAGISTTKLTHEEVKETANRVEQSFAGLILDVIPRLAP